MWHHVGRLPISLSLQQTEIALYGLPESPIRHKVLDMLGHPCPWEVKMSDPGCERVSFFTRPRLGEIILIAYGTTPPPFRNFGRNSLGVGDQILFMTSSEDLATGEKGFRSACAHTLFSALFSGTLAVLEFG
ncbi:hypothetical protein Tco_0732007 [Tanacetum coccineum]